MKILGIEHIGIAVKGIDQDAPFWKHILNLSHQGTEVVKDQGVTTDIYDTGKGKIELLESLGVDTPIGKFLEKKGIQCLIHYPKPTHIQKAFNDYKKFDLRNTNIISKEILSLPSYPSLTDDQVNLICENIKPLYHLRKIFLIRCNNLYECNLYDHHPNGSTSKRLLNNSLFF